MKHFIRLSLFFTILLFFGIELVAQDFAPSNDIVTKTEVESEFKAYISSLKNPPEISDSVIFVQNFLETYNGKTIVVIDASGDTILNPEYGKGVTEIALCEILREERKQFDSIEPEPEPEKKRSHPYWIWIVAIVLIVAFLFIIKSKKKEKNIIVAPNNSNNNDNNIVVRRKTTSALKKQSLEDVIDDDNYMKIDCNDFCDDSAVRRIYVKNTCVKDIYNMYAEDLRNPENPKEDGCMVLGRWVYDQSNDEYYVSLEHVVFPGDDAVFSEYELNFGAKIKLNILTKLRKLRQETQLQYDLTCWVHSHPGIGVFFSNTDYSLHMLHKHPTHPKFLTAIVIDILTPQQELGIFTFKHDMSINSKAELKKTYALEDWYKWAVESTRNTFKQEDHFNSMQNVKSHIETCHDIHFSNSAIIDIGLLTAEQSEGFIGCVHGFANHKSGNTEFVITQVSPSETGQNSESIGSFIIVTHCSIPSVRKALADQLSKIGFALVYSTADGLLTSIPVINNDLCIDQNFYGEQQLEELKIWTRRKR